MKASSSAMRLLFPFPLLLAFCLVLFLSAPFCVAVVPPASRRLTSGHVGILSRLSPDGTVTANLTDGEAVMSFKLDPFPRNGVDAGVKDCSLSFDSLASRRIINSEDVRIEFFGEEVVADLVDACNKISLWGAVEGIASQLVPKYAINAKAFAKSGVDFVVPGTKWCGLGDVATNEDDLGKIADVDACCRDHDLCPYNIKAFQTKDHYWNARPHTVSMCGCDEAFFNCLKGVKEHHTVAATVGKFFFDTVGPPCVKHEKGKYCRKWHWSLMWCEATAEGLAAIPYNYLDGNWDKGSSVEDVLESLGTPATQIPPIKS